MSVLWSKLLKKVPPRFDFQGLVVGTPTLALRCHTDSLTIKAYLLEAPEDVGFMPDGSGVSNKVLPEIIKDDVAWNWFVDPIWVNTPLPPGIDPPDPVSTVIVNEDKSPLVKVITLSTTEAVVKESAELADAAKGKVKVTPFALVKVISPTPPEAVMIASGITLPNAFTDTLSKNLVFCAMKNSLCYL